MTTVDVDASRNHGEHRDPPVTDIFESRPGLPEADGIDYLRDVNVAVRDIINLFRATLEAVERSLSMGFDPASSPRGNVHPVFSPEETGRVHSAGFRNDGRSTSPDISAAASAFLTQLRFLVDYTEKRINVSPTQQQEQERKIRHAVRSSGKTEADIKSLNDVLTAQRTEHEKSVGKLNSELNECRNAVEQRADEIENEIKRIVNESEIGMTEFYKESIAREELLRLEAKLLETGLKNLRRNNILGENNLRDKRRKAETRLLDYLAKYDEDIGGRYREMKNSAKEFGLLNSQRKMLEDNVMVDLRKLHDDLQREKAEAVRKILNERVEKFARNRAARVIQKAWRAFWERHCAKKKKKSRKK